MSTDAVLSKTPAAQPRLRNATACTAVICAFAATSILSTNIFLPSLPAMAADLRVSSAAVTSTITVFLAIVAVGQLIAGPLSDRFGRRMPVLLARNSLPPFLAAASIFLFGLGIVSPLSSTAALSPFADRAGAVAALFGFAQMAGAACGASLAAAPIRR